MHFTVYKTTNLINGKIYIGTHQTENLLDEYLGSGHQIKRAIAKYGVENFRKEILFDFDNAPEMFDKEAELVTEEFCKRDDTYNICPGGQGGWGYLNSTVWTKEKRREHNKRVSPFKNFTKEQKSENSKKAIAVVQAKMREDPTIRMRMYEKQRQRFLDKTNCPTYGRKFINNGTKNMMLKPGHSLPEGWSFGRIKLS